MFKYILAGGVLVLVLLGAGWLVRARADARRHADVLAFAQQLGYTEPARLVQSEWCWDLAAHCGIFIHYTTDLGMAEFRKRVGSLGLSESLARPSDGSTIFTEINTHSGRRLTANGYDGNQRTTGMKKPEAYRWWLTDQRNQNLFISYYSTAATGDSYAIDGQQIHGDIVTVMLQTR